MKIALTIILFSLLLQCKTNSTQTNTETDVAGNETNEPVNDYPFWQDTTHDAATAKAGELEIDRYRTVYIDYDAFFEYMSSAPLQADANEANRVKFALPLPYDDTEEFALHQVQVMSLELAEKYPQIKTYEGRSVIDPTTSIRLDYGENGANYMVIKAGEQIFLQPVKQGNREIYIIYNKKDVKRHPIDFEKPSE